MTKKILLLGLLCVSWAASKAQDVTKEPIIGVMAVPAAEQPKEEDYGTRVELGQQAPDFEVEMLCGTKVKLSDFRGKVVLLNFWATWCPPCRAEFKRVQKDLIERFEGRDFVFLPISRGEKHEKVAAFMADNGYTFPAGLDTAGSIYALYAEKAIPRNFLIDAEGRVADIEIGYDEESFAALADKIENTLKSK